jgi:DivIVA domain-containing protein
LKQDSIERIRSVTFAISRKGYDKREVERFLNKLADWLEAGGGDQARSDLVKRELERVGEKTTRILSEAEDSAEQLRTEAEQEASNTLARAEEDADRTCRSADDYAARTRQTADNDGERIRDEAEKSAQETRAGATQEARMTIDDAQSKARRIVEEGAKRRGDIEAVISDLVRRRDALLAEVDQLTSELKAVLAGHTPRPGADPFASPKELDPAERGDADRRPPSTQSPEPEPEREPVEASKRSAEGGSGRPRKPRRGRTAGGEQVKA